MKIVALFTLLLLSSCATDIDFNVPGNRFDTPETSGKTLGGEVGIGYGESVKVTTADVLADVIFNTFDSVNTDTDVKKNSAMQFNANIGIIERLDVTYKNYTDAPSFYGAKFQFFGKPGVGSENGVKASVGAAIAYMKEDEGNLVVGGTNGNERREYKGELTINGQEYSANLGYRFGKDFILYLNNYYSKLKTTSRLTSTTHGNTTINGNVISQGHLLGARVGQRFFLMAEVGVNKMRWERSIEKTTYPIGFFGGFSW